MLPASGPCRARPALRHAGQCGPAAGLKFWTGSGESAGTSSGTNVWDPTGNRTGIHAVQYSNFSCVFPSGFYRITISIPIYVFNKRYPKDPVNFGEKIRCKRMDSGLQIKELAKILGVTEDTLINWEKRGVSPTSKNLERLVNWMGTLQ